MTMKKTYITPQTNTHHIVSSRFVCASGPTSGDQDDPTGPGSGSGSRGFLNDWDDDDMNDEDL